MAAPRINRIEYDRDDGVVIETSVGLLVELLPYSTWREGGDELQDAGHDLPTDGIAWRFGPWVLTVTPGGSSTA